ncbi:MAG: serine/threonine-protein kinase [Gemmatimonadota bacterium]
MTVPHQPDFPTPPLPIQLPALDGTADFGTTDPSPYRTTTERPPHLEDWELPREWTWGTDGVWIGYHRHTQQVIDPLGRTLSLVTAPDPAHWEWLTAEARALGNRRHKVIPTTYVYWPRNEVAPRGPGYVRHWIDGVSLAKQLRTRGPDSIEHAMTRLRSIGACLAMLHDRDETHGALNGEASWMSRAGEHSLLGWQWALPLAALPPGKLPSLQWTVAAPEWRDAIAAGGMWWRPTPATDQFQLGALTIAALTGVTWSDDGGEALGALDAGTHVPRSVREVLRRAVSLAPESRFPSVAMLLQLLDRAIGGESSLAGLAFSTPALTLDNDPEKAEARQQALLRAATGLDYELLEQLGRGASGSVWRGRDLALHRDVALKALNPEIALDPAAISRLRREARVLASIAHPRIIPVLEFAERQGVAYFTMPLTPGGSLADRVTTQGALPLSEVGPELEALLDAIATAHTAGVVHRDVKPENILLDRSGHWNLADFGIAAPPGESGAAGTLAFAAPEQLRGTPQDEGVDRFALTAVAFFALTGHLPFVAHDPELQLWRQEQGIDWESRWAAKVPGPIRAWIARGLAFTASERFPDTATMRDAWIAAWKAVVDQETPAANAPARAKDGGGTLRSFLKASKRLLPALSL